MPILREDPQLLDSFRAGAPAALALVYRTYAGRVARTLARALPTSSPEARGRSLDVDDLVQDVFIRAFRAEARHGYDGVRPYASYLLAIGRNLLIDRLRLRVREIPVPLEDRATVEGTPSEAAPDEDRTLALQAVERYVKDLPPGLRQVHELRFVCDLSQTRAASTIGTTRQRLRTLESRLTSGLRRELARLELFG